MQSIGQKFLGLVLMAASAPAMAQAPQTPKEKVSIVPLKQEGVPIITATDISGSISTGKGIYFNVASGDDDDGPIMANFDNQTVHLILNMPNGDEPTSCIDFHTATIIPRLMPHSSGRTAFRLIAAVTSPTMNFNDQTIKEINETGCVVADVTENMLMQRAWHSSTEELSKDPKAVVIADNFISYGWALDRDKQAVYFNLPKDDAAKVDAAAKEGRPLRVVLFKPDNVMPADCFPISATIVKAANSSDNTAYQLLGPPGQHEMFVALENVSNQRVGGCAIVQTQRLPPPPKAGLFQITKLPNMRQLSQPQK